MRREGCATGCATPSILFSTSRPVEGSRAEVGNVAARSPHLSPTCGEGGSCDEQGKRCKGDELEEVKGSADERRAARGGWKRRETAGTKLFLMSYALALTKCC